MGDGAVYAREESSLSGENYRNKRDYSYKVEDINCGKLPEQVHSVVGKSRVPMCAGMELHDQLEWIEAYPSPWFTAP